MMVTVVEELKKLASVNIFEAGRAENSYLGRPFYLDFTRTKVLVNDVWKQRTGGVPSNAFLLCFYDNEPEVDEAILLRVLGPTALPSDPDVIAAMVEHYKENVPAGSATNRLDSYTRYEFQFSGLECRVLGTFYKDESEATVFGADVDNFYSPNNYSVYKPGGKALEYIVNFREGEGIPGGVGDRRIGQVRYSATRRHEDSVVVPVYVSAIDFLGKRSAMFGMTRTGKSNSVKKVIQEIREISRERIELPDGPIEPVGQIIFDVNGEYANANQQDEGTAIFELFDAEDEVVRYSVIEKPGFRVMKLNFYESIEEGFGMITALLRDDNADYVKSFCAVDLTSPDDSDTSATVRHQRRVAAYNCCLNAAGFAPPSGFKVKFEGNSTLNSLAHDIDPKRGVTLDQATTWLTLIWEKYGSHEYFSEYRRKNGREWADEDLKAMLTFLTRRREGGGGGGISGYLKLRQARERHTSTAGQSFENDIVDLLRRGKIVIADLSQGDPELQRIYSERICMRIFRASMDSFVANEPMNFIQMYFEEAHNLFPRRDDRNLGQIYTRLAKEGAKLRIGLSYATQEVSSISSNILKNTQNWFITHLNNQDELREIQKYYDFEDFVDSLRMTMDKGFTRVKTYSNAFTVPVQIDRFSIAQPDED